MTTMTFFDWAKKLLSGDKIVFDQASAKEFKEWLNYWRPTLLINEQKTESDKIILSI